MAACGASARSSGGAANRANHATAAVGSAVVLWASAFVAIRAAVPHYGAFGLTAARLLVASVAFAVAAAVIGVQLPNRQDVPRLLLAGALGMSGYQLLLNLGQLEVAAGTASIIVATAPAFTAFLARPLLGEQLTATQTAGIGAAMFGVIVVATGTGDRLTLEPAALVVLGAAVAHAAYFVILKPLLEHYTPWEVTAWTTWLGTVVALPLVVTLPGAITSAPWDAHLAVLHLGIGASAVGFLALSFALRSLDASVAAVYLYLVPPTTALIGWVWLGELPTPQTLAGGAIVIGGVALAKYGVRQTRATRTHIRPLRGDRVQ